METDCGVGDSRIVCKGQKSPEDEIVISAQGGLFGKSLTQMFCLSFIWKSLRAYKGHRSISRQKKELYE